MRSKVPTGAINSALVSKRVRPGLPAALLALLLFFPARAQDMNKQPISQTSNAEKCISNLQRIYRLLKLHLHRSAGVLEFPSNLDLLYSMAKDPKPFICSADKRINTSVKKETFRTSYEIVNDPLKSKLSTMPPNRVAIVAEKRPNHNGQRFVLFYDGSVRAFDGAQFELLKDSGFIDTKKIDTNR